MTGPEHYQEAERSLRFASDPNSRSYMDPVVLQRAQVHATLALAAVNAQPKVVV